MKSAPRSSYNIFFVSRTFSNSGADRGCNTTVDTDGEHLGQFTPGSLKTLASKSTGRLSLRSEDGVLVKENAKQEHFLSAKVSGTTVVVGFINFSDFVLR